MDQGVKVGVYVDVSNISMSGGFGMRFDVLRQFACRGGGIPMRLNAYVSYDEQRAKTDNDYYLRQTRFHTALRDIGFKVILKIVKWYTDEDGNRYGKSNADMELGIDAVMQSEKLDRVMIVSGDGDFVRVVHALQNRGCRVEVLAFDSVSSDLRKEADMYFSGYLVPNLLPFQEKEDAGEWGEMHSWVRGVCVTHEKGYGFFRIMMEGNDELWRLNYQDPLYPYKTIFFHDSFLPGNIESTRLPARNLVFEFKIENGREGGKTQAKQISCIRALT